MISGTVPVIPNDLTCPYLSCFCSFLFIYETQNCGSSPGSSNHCGPSLGLPQSIVERCCNSYTFIAGFIYCFFIAQSSLLYYNLFTTYDIHTLCRGLAIQFSAVKRVPQASPFCCFLYFCGTNPRCLAVPWQSEETTSK